MDYLNRALLDDDIVRLKKRIKSRWTQYQWENEHQQNTTKQDCKFGEKIIIPGMLPIIRILEI